MTTPTAKATKELTKAQLQPNLGLYWNQDSDDVRNVTIRDGKLLIAGSPGRVAAVTENTFVTTGPGNIEYRFEPQTASSRPRLVETRPSAEPLIFTAVEEFKPSAMDLTQYNGRYRSDELDPVYTIVGKGDKLFFLRQKFPDAEIKPTVRDVFTANGRNWRFVRDSKGAVAGMALKQSRTQNILFVKEIPSATVK